MLFSERTSWRSHRNAARIGTRPIRRLIKFDRVDDV
jgi:hypothetical protein